MLSSLRHTGLGKGLGKSMEERKARSREGLAAAA